MNITELFMKLHSDWQVHLFEILPKTLKSKPLFKGCQSNIELLINLVFLCATLILQSMNMYVTPPSYVVVKRVS